MGEEEQYVWNKQEGETARWYGRFLLFLYLGHNRTLIDAVRQEVENYNKLQQEREAQSLASKSLKKPPKKTPGSWKTICEQRQWWVRATKYDEHQQQLEDKQREAERLRILSNEFALMHERVKGLNQLANQLQGLLGEKGNIWLIDANGIKFNDALFREYRAVLTDIASEMGERAKVSKQELTGKDGGPVEMNNVQVHLFLPDDD